VSCYTPTSSEWPPLYSGHFSLSPRWLLWRGLTVCSKTMCWSGNNWIKKNLRTAKSSLDKIYVLTGVACHFIWCYLPSIHGIISLVMVPWCCLICTRIFSEDVFMIKYCILSNRLHVRFQLYNFLNLLIFHFPPLQYSYLYFSQYILSSVGNFHIL